MRYAANVAGSHVSGSDPCRGKQEFPNHQQERSAFHAETCHTNCGDPASLGLTKSLLVNPRPLIRRTINELRWPSSVPIATASPPPLQPAPSVAAPEPTADTKVKASTDKGSKDLLRIPPEFSYTNSGLLIKLGHSTTSAELAKMLSSAGVPSSAAPSLADQHSDPCTQSRIQSSPLCTYRQRTGHGWSEVVLTRNESSEALCCWRIALTILLPLAYFFTRESSPFAGKWVLDATESQYSSDDVPSAATVTVTGGQF